jgi:hypothetical protein
MGLHGSSFKAGDERSDALDTVRSGTAHEVKTSSGRENDGRGPSWPRCDVVKLDTCRWFLGRRTSPRQELEAVTGC